MLTLGSPSPTNAIATRVAFVSLDSQAGIIGEVFPCSAYLAMDGTVYRNADYNVVSEDIKASLLSELEKVK